MKYELSYTLFTSIFINIFCITYFKYGEVCLNENKVCGEDNDFSQCSYYNLFCKAGFAVTYKEGYESKYINYFSSLNSLKSVCGEKDIKFEKKPKKQIIEILKINKDTSQELLRNENLHCCYKYENQFYKESNKNLSLIVEHSGNSINNKLNFMIIIMLFSNSNSANILDLNHLQNSNEMIDLRYYKSFTIFVDVDSNQNIQESISISLNYKDNKKFSPIYILLLILAGLIFIIIIIVIISVIRAKYRRNERHVHNNNNENELTEEELEKREKIQKIKQLFETELLPHYYSKELDDKEYNGCTICLKKFRDNISKISILPCNHLFHYKCLYDWLINNQHWKCPICNMDLTENVKLFSKSNKASQDQINIQKLNLNIGLNTIRTQTSNELLSLNAHNNSHI